MILEIRSLLVGAALGAILAAPAAIAATLSWYTSRQLEREAQSLALALGCGPSTELEFAVHRGAGVVRCKPARSAPAKGSGD